MRFYKISFLVKNFLDSTFCACSNYVLHFHGFHCENGIAFFKLSSLFDKHFGNSSWHRSNCLQSSTCILGRLFSVIRLEFESNRIPLRIEKIYRIIFHKILNFSDLAIDCGNNFSRCCLSIFKCVLLVVNFDNSTFTIFELC